MKKLFSALIVIAVAGSSCGAGVSRPRVNENAEIKLRERVVESAEVRAVISRVHTALEPLDAVVSDYTRAVGKSLTAHNSRKHLQRFTLGKFRRTLKNLEKSLLVKRAAGAKEWSVTKDIDWPFERENRRGEDCTRTTLRLDGKQLSDNSVELTMYLSDCQEAPREVFRATGAKDKELDVRFNAALLTETLDSEIKLEGCSISLNQDDSSHVVCDPVLIKSGDFSVNLKTLTANRAGSKSEALIIGEVLEKAALVGTLRVDWKNSAAPKVEWKKAE